MFNQWLPSYLDLSAELEIKLISSLIIILLLWLLRLLIVRLIDRQITDIRARYLWRKCSTYWTVFLSVIFVSPLWLAGIQSIATFLGLISAGLVIALQGPLTDLGGWLFILWRRPFEVGDRIQIGEHAGDVVDVRIFQFTLLEIGNWVHADQSTGRILHIPNKKVFSEPLANYNKGLGYIWHEIEVLITFESHWQKAKVILEEIANRDVANLSQDAAERVRLAARRFLILYPTLTPIVYTRVRASGVELTLRYLSDPRRRRSTEQTIWEAILKAFAEHSDIEFAYPTQRFYHRALEQQDRQNSAIATEKN
jgi:small-conductance mechanosensitive channel